MFKVMSFNIRGAVHADGPNSWSQRADLNCQTILQAAPDIIGFQELMTGNKETYDAKLPDYAYKLGPRVSMENRAGTWEHPAIYWRRDRFQRIGAGHFYLSKTPERYALHWGAQQGRALTWVQLRDREYNQDLVIMNTHFSHVSAEARLRSAEMVGEHAATFAATHPVILTGDFNVTAYRTPGPTPYSVLLKAGFADTLPDASQGSQPTHTFHNFKGDLFDDLHLRIDWILVNDPADGLQTQAASIIRDAQPPLYPSDHYPVVATFAYP